MNPSQGTSQICFKFFAEKITKIKKTVLVYFYNKLTEKKILYDKTKKTDLKELMNYLIFLFRFQIFRRLAMVLLKKNNKYELHDDEDQETIKLL